MSEVDGNELSSLRESPTESVDDEHGNEEDTLGIGETSPSLVGWTTLDEDEVGQEDTCETDAGEDSESMSDVNGNGWERMYLHMKVLSWRDPA